MVTCTINGREVEVAEGCTILHAAESIGVQIPYFCYHPALPAPANCRMCLVEVEGLANLQPSCRTPVSPGMVVHTENRRVLDARRGVLEFILINHPVDCPICDQAGECWLQDHYQDHDFHPSRLRTEKVSKLKTHHVGRELMLDGERCILCTRCLRFCDHITKTSEIALVERGDSAEIRTFPGRRLDNPYSMCTADLCPVGALTTIPFRFRRRVWLLESAPSICTGCANNCAVQLDFYRQRAERYLPRYHPNVNQYWMCDAGRYTVDELNRDLLLEVRIDNQVLSDWPVATFRIAQRLTDVVPGGPEGPRWGMLLTPQCNTEGLAAAALFAERCLNGAKLFVGGKPDGEGDEFLISPDKNPNRAGLLRATREVPLGTPEELVEQLEDGRIEALYLMGSHLALSESWLERFVEATSRLDLFVVQSSLRVPFAEQAQVVIPAANHAEQGGTFINDMEILQSVEAAYPALGARRPDWEIFRDLARAMKSPLPIETALDALALVDLEPIWPQDVAPAIEHTRSPHGALRSSPKRLSIETKAKRRR